LVKLLADKRERKYNTLEAKLYHIVSRLVSEYGLALLTSDVPAGDERACIYQGGYSDDR